MLDVTGREVFKKDFIAQQQQRFNTGLISNGNYRIVLSGSNGPVITGSVSILQ
jgi:hypothetical protein